MVCNFPADLVLPAKGTDLVRIIIFYNAHYFFRIHLGIGPADFGQRYVYVNGTAPGW